MKLLKLLPSHSAHIPFPRTKIPPSPPTFGALHYRFSTNSVEVAASNHAIPSNPIRSFLDSSIDVKSTKKIHALLVVRGLTTSLPFQTKLLSSYGSLGNVKFARKVFDRIPNPDLYSWKVMLRWYIMNDRYAEAIGFYWRMRLCLGEYDNVVCSLVLRACVKLLDIDEGKKLHCHITKSGSPDCFLLNILIDMYAKCGALECARRVFDDIPERNMVSWTSIMSGYVQRDRPEEGLILFNQMREVDVEPSEHTVGTLLAACSMLDALHQGKWIHGYVVKNGMCVNTFVGSALLDMYVKRGEVADARSVFDGLRIVDLVSWTAMIVGYTQKGRPVEALKLFFDKKWADIVPNSVTTASALSASAQLRDFNLGQSIHVLGIKLGLEGYSVIMNSLVDMYMKCSATREATYIFEKIPHKDIISWNAIIAGCSQNEFGYDALSLINRMRSDGGSPDAVTVVSALSACASLGASNLGSCFHGYAFKFAFLANVFVSTALVNLYNKCGDLISARRVFDEMRGRNTVTWCAMIGGYGMQGDSVGSLNLFTEMLREELRPNDVTFTSILSTCSHNGMVGEGRKLFDSMSREYNIVPSMKHYACMVDMLARAGELEGALDFIEKMPFEADVSVWGAFLHGCKLHSKLGLGEVAMKRMMELRPGTPDYYVLMSNLYASTGRWSDAVKIRGLMKERGMIKLPGCSFVGMEKG